MEQNLRESYDRFAAIYEKQRGEFDMIELFERFFTGLEVENGALLDLGCGAGEPFSRWFLERRWRVTGVDFSSEMLALARRYAPGMQTVQSDMCDVDFAENSFDAIIASYSLFHVPREKHPLLFRRFVKWLRPGGQALFTYATQEYTGAPVFDGMKEFLGYSLFYSHDEESTLLANLEQSGLKVRSACLHEIGGETFLWVTVQR